MSPEMNAQVEKFAHVNTCGLLGLSYEVAASDASLIFGVQGVSATEFRELTAREITGFDCPCIAL